ncbi:Heterokaryon incompatibility protein [Rutstroemia sp. NJR-2017a BBW]|nr:Heterokaryon incompatibility protein [Rutstroemia sp. NJR-2017a BBW]
MEGTLRVVPLYYSPRYVALSYVWGQKPLNGKTYTVRCGDVEVAVSKNCIAALSCIREKFGNISIWVDSICINQDEPAELEEQLPLMGEIYSQAYTVFVWLGLENASANAGLEYSEARAIQETLRHEWFQRGWTFQELIMANNPVFLTESRSLTWNDILCAKDQLLLESPSMSSKTLEDRSASIRYLVPLNNLWKSVPFSLSGYEFWTYLLIGLELWSSYRFIIALQLHEISARLLNDVLGDPFLLLNVLIFGPRLVLSITPLYTMFCRCFVGDPCRHCPFMQFFGVLPLIARPFIIVQVWNAMTDSIILMCFRVVGVYENLDWTTIPRLISVYNQQRQLECGSIIHAIRTREVTQSIDRIRAFYLLL